MKLWTKTQPATGAPKAPPHPGIPRALDGSAAVVAMETAAGEAAGAYPITPSTQMGEGWAAAVAEGKENVNGRRLLFFEPEGEHAAAAVTAGMSMAGLRATNFSSGQGIAYMHESLYAAVGKRLTYVLNVAARAMTKQGLNVHAGHDDYHAVDDTGFFQLFAKDVQEAADLNLIAHRIAELSLNPGICAQDGFLTSHVIESALVPEPALVKAYLGDPSDRIESPTPAQRLVFGETRRRIPEMFDLDYPAMLGVVQNQDSYAQGVAAQRPFYFDHVAPLADRAFDEYAALTGRRYTRAAGYKLEDAEWVIVGQGSVVPNAMAVADYLRDARKLKVGVLNLTMFRPFPADLVGLAAGRQARRRGAGAPRPAAGRRSADAARDPRRHVQGGGERPRLQRPRAARRHPGAPRRPGARLLLRLLRTRQPRPAARRPRGGGGQHAARRPAPAPVLPRRGLHSRRHAHSEAPDLAGAARRRVSAPEGIVAAAGHGAQPAAQGVHRRAHPLRGRVGRDHDGQEPGDDGVRAVRAPHQGQPEVRLGEEGAADDVLRRAGARADSAQLRTQARGRGAVARPERVPPQRSAGRARRRRRVRDPERRRPRRRSGPACRRACARPFASATSSCSCSTRSPSPARKPRTSRCASACRARPSSARSSRRRR